MKERFSAPEPDTVDDPKTDAASVTDIATLPENNNALTIGAFSGFSGADLIIPRVNVIQKMSSNADDFTVGDIVLNKSILLAHANEPLHFVLISATQCYQERLDYDPDGPLPEQYASANDALAAGHTLTWADGPGGKRVPPTAEPRADITMFVRGHEDNPLPYTGPDGNTYNIAVMTLTRTAYNAAKAIATELFHRRLAAEAGPKAMLTMDWQMTATKKTNGSYEYFTPKVKLNSVPTSTECVDFFLNTLNTLQGK